MHVAAGVYLLNSSVLALEPGHQRHLTTLPSGSIVRIAEGNPDASGLIAVSVGERQLQLFLIDLEERAERIAEQSN